MKRSSNASEHWYKSKGKMKWRPVDVRRRRIQNRLQHQPNEHFVRPTLKAMNHFHSIGLNQKKICCLKTLTFKSSRTKKTNLSHWEKAKEQRIDRSSSQRTQLTPKTKTLKISRSWTIALRNWEKERIKSLENWRLWSPFPAFLRCIWVCFPCKPQRTRILCFKETWKEIDRKRKASLIGSKWEKYFKSNWEK